MTDLKSGEISRVLQKGVRFLFYLLVCFGVSGWNYSMVKKKKNRHIYKNEEKTCCIKWNDPIFSLIVPSLKTDGGSGD